MPVKVVETHVGQVRVKPKLCQRFSCLKLSRGFGSLYDLVGGGGEFVELVRVASLLKSNVMTCYTTLASVHCGYLEPSGLSF